MKTHLLYPNILSNWSYDEGKVEEDILKIKEIDKFEGQELFYMNIKSLSDNDITSYKELRELNKKHILDPTKFTDTFKTKFRKEFYYFEKL